MRLKYLPLTEHSKPIVGSIIFDSNFDYYHFHSPPSLTISDLIPGAIIMSIDFVLASASPSRRKLLQSMGINPFICASNFDESKVQLSDPVARVETLAQRKVELSKLNLEIRSSWVVIR
jgi:Maf-like protein